MSLNIINEQPSKHFQSDSNKIDLLKSLQSTEFNQFVKEKFNIQNIEIKTHPKTIKFRRWKQSWPLPKNLSVELDTIRYTDSRADQSIIKNSLWSKIEHLEEFKKRSKLIKPNYWGAQFRIPYKIIKNRVSIKIHDNWIFRNYVPKKDDFYYEKEWIYLNIPDEFIWIGYKSNDFHNNFIFLPRYIRTDNFFFEGLGLQQGDGTQAYGDVHITFTNSNINLVVHQVKWFERLGINKNAIRIYPELPNLNYNEEFEKQKEKLIDYGIKKIQFRKPKIGQNCVKPNIQLVFHNRLFKLYYLFLLKNLRDLVLTNKNYIISYLKGIFASEGCVRTNSRKTINNVKISVKSKTRREFYKKCLRKLKIYPSKDELTKNSEAVIITNSINFKKLYNLGLLDLHINKKRKFESAIKNYKKIKIMEE